MNSYTTSSYSWDDTSFSTVFSQDYLGSFPILQKFYDFNPDEKGLDEALKQRQKYATPREDLAKSLFEQYEKMEKDFFVNPENDVVHRNIELLKKDNTFTVTTGHQPLFLGGQLFFFYKIVSAINQAAYLQKKYPDFNIVPVFWMASEDHDFEEVSKATLFGKEQKWQKEVDNEPVGSLDPSGCLDVLNELKPKLEETHNGKFIFDLFERAYNRCGTFACATRYWLNRLFRNKGLIILDPMDQRLKQHIKDIAQKDIIERKYFQLVNDSKEELQKKYKTPVNPREINFFLFENGKRLRLKEESGKISTDDGSRQFSEEELQKIINESPEKLSPNVVTRPLFQEKLLPNISYVGGPSEIAYWMELKTSFRETGIFFPAITLRNSAVWIGKGLSKKINKLQIPADLFLEEKDKLVDKFLEKKENNQQLENEIASLEASLESLKSIASGQHSDIQKKILDFAVPQSKGVQKFRKELNKAFKAKNEAELEQLLKIYDRLFPNGNPQERVDNFIPYYLDHGGNFLARLLDFMKPIGGEVLIFSDE